MVNPYSNAPRRAFWRTAVTKVAPVEVDPVAPFPRLIDKGTRITSAGSCFAANVTRYLVRFGYNYLFTEKLHPFFSERSAGLAKSIGLGEYSAGYGNIYTPRQMIQLVQRAYGEFEPNEDRWQGKDGIIDPFRARIELTASTPEEFVALRDQHFKAVRQAFEGAEVLVFTFGLTEAWRSKEDDTIFPVCPGTVGGDFNPARHEFVNFSVDDITRDGIEMVELLRRRNPGLRIILTVSPVPLVATATDRHVLEATTYSKSVLRVAASQVASRLPDVHYFPAYEIITGQHAEFDVYETDRRSVAEKGVSHVMKLFFRHVAGDDDAWAEIQSNNLAQPVAVQMEHPQSAAEAISAAACEEELIEATRFG